MYEVGFDKVPWFPDHKVQIAVAISYLACLPIMSIMLFTRFPPVQTFREMTSWRMPYSKVTILIALLASWCYILVGGVLSLGVGLSQSLTECSRGLFLCTWFYTTTKLGVYLFLMERAFIVRGGGVRMRSWHYRFNFFLLGCWLVVFILLEVGRKFSIREDGVCIFGWEWWALIPLMSLDVFVNLYLLAMFVIPLFRNQFINRKLRNLAIKALWTSLGSVIATMSNLIMLIMIEAPGWLCLGSCSIDIFANAVLLFYMTLTLRSDEKQAKVAWTINGFNHTDSRVSGRGVPSLNNSGGSRGLKNQWTNRLGPQVDLPHEFELRSSDSNHITTTVEAKQVNSERSVGDNESDMGILPPSGIHVSHRVDYAYSAATPIQ
ncbi:transmembrane protein [Neofusicoccum parvum]|nr:transmembrane protein [Neofusicoccum parvum]